jgi:PucR family transcriptional regulator, proline-responsive transcriptional activator
MLESNSEGQAEAYSQLVQRTAARLNLHRSSLYYRLDRIAGLLATDLSSGFVRLELPLALKSRRAERRTLG